MKTVADLSGASQVTPLTTKCRDTFERSMVDFAIRWCQFGGGSSQDIFEEFGLFEADFFRRVLDLTIELSEDNGDHQQLCEEVRRVCRLRLLQKPHPFAPPASPHGGRAGWTGAQYDISGA